VDLPARDRIFSRGFTLAILRLGGRPAPAVRRTGFTIAMDVGVALLPAGAARGRRLGTGRWLRQLRSRPLR